MIEELFESAEWQKVKDAISVRIESRMHSAISWSPLPGYDAGTSLAVHNGILKEVEALLWVRDVLPRVLTEEEERQHHGNEGDRRQGGEGGGDGERREEEEVRDRFARELSGKPYLWEEDHYGPGDPG